MTKRFLVPLAAMTLVLPTAQSFVPSTASPLVVNLYERTTSKRSDLTSLYYYMDDEVGAGGSGKDAVPLPLSQSDLARLQSLRRRQITVPVMILDALLPNQVLTLQSSDPTFLHMLKYCCENTQRRVVVIGENPVTRQPLSFGVLATIEQLQHPIIVNHINDQKTAVTVQVTALQRIQIQGEPWDHAYASFSMADCQTMDVSEERLSAPEAEKAKQLAAKLPNMIQQWKEQVVAAGVTDEAGLSARETMLGGMPTAEESSITADEYWTALAFYAAGMLNPIPTIPEVGLLMMDIRPAMVSAQTAYERLLLAVAALQSSMDQLSSDNHH